MYKAEQTLLLIDDDQEVRAGLGAYLREVGYQLLTASSPQEGIALFTEASPDLVLCDLNMANQEGVSLVEALREQSPLKPIIVLSSDQDMGHVLTALRQGANDYLGKPIADMDMVDHAIERCLELIKLQQQNLDYRRRLQQINHDLEASLKILEQDQRAGRKVHSRLLPQTPKKFGDFCFSQKVIPSLYLSGDFIDYFIVGDHHVVFYIADVSGHGASSAFVTVLMKNFFARKRSEYRHFNDDTILSPVKLLKLANRGLIHSGIGKHATLCMGVLDMREDTLTYSIAGHLPLPLLATDGGCEYLQGEGMPVGLFESAEYSQQTLQLPDKFVLTFFTDGILEIIAPDSLLEQETFLRDKLSGGIVSIEEIAQALEVDHIKEVPDDVAALVISRQ